GVGVLIGLAVSLGIAFYLNRTPIPFMAAKPKPVEKNGAAAKGPAIAGLPQGGATPGAPASGAPEKPKFDFYRILPGSEEPVSDKELRERERQQRARALSARPPRAAAAVNRKPRRTFISSRQARSRTRPTPTTRRRAWRSSAS